MDTEAHVCRHIKLNHVDLEGQVKTSLALVQEYVNHGPCPDDAHAYAPVYIDTQRRVHMYIYAVKCTYSGLSSRLLLPYVR